LINPASNMWRYDRIGSNLNKLLSHSRKQGSSDHNSLTDKQEFIGRYKKLMLMLINAPTPDRPFLESFPTLAGSPAVGPGAAGTDSSWRKRSSLRPDESFKVNREVTAVSQMLLDWNWTWSSSRELFIVLSFQIVLDTLPLSFQLETKTIDRKTKTYFIFYKYCITIFFDYYCYTIGLLVDLGQDPEGAQGFEFSIVLPKVQTWNRQLLKNEKRSKNYFDYFKSSLVTDVIVIKIVIFL
jgi:hypothetical protein